MKDSKLITLLSSFSEEELKEFEKFVASPYFCRGRDLLPVYKVIRSFYPGFSGINLNSEYVFKKLFPRKKFIEKSSLSLINTLTSELYKIGKRFLIQSELEESDTEKDYFLLNNLRKKNLLREFEKESKRVEENEKTVSGTGADQYVKRYILERAYVEYFIEKQDYKSAFTGLTSQTDNLIIAALHSSLNLIRQKGIAETGYNIRTHPSIADFFLNNTDLEKFTQELYKYSDKYFPFVKVSHLGYLMFINPGDEKYFYELKAMVYDNIDSFSQEERFILFGNLVSYCSDKIIKKENNKFSREQFELFVKSLELGCHKWSKAESFPFDLFRNILASALSCKEFEWAEYFLNNYVDDLIPEHKDNMRSYSLALIEYSKKNYEAALENLSRVEYKFFLFKIDVKDLLFKIYYELGHFESALSVLKTMKQYINNTQDLSEIVKIRHNNFVKYSNELLSIKLSETPKDPGLLKIKLEKEDQIFSREWLLKKVSS